MLVFLEMYFLSSVVPFVSVSLIVSSSKHATPHCAPVQNPAHTLCTAALMYRLLVCTSAICSDWCCGMVQVDAAAKDHSRRGGMLCLATALFQQTQGGMVPRGVPPHHWSGYAPSPGGDFASWQTTAAGESSTACWGS